MNSNRSSNQGRGKAKGKNPAENKKQKQKARKPNAKQPRQKGAAAAYASTQVGSSPSIAQTSADSCRIRHRELIGNVMGTVAFTIGNTFAVNPGLQGTFPWLSSMAQAWECYRFKSLKFCYYTRTGTSTPGSVSLALDPDASDAAPASEQLMSTYENCVEDAPWKDLCLHCKPTTLQEIGPKKFIRTGALLANQDIKLYDAGNFFVGTVDGTAVAWGKLWVEYDVEFFVPQSQPAGNAPASFVVNATGSGCTAGAPMGSSNSTVITGTLVSGVTDAATGSSVVSLQNLVIGAEYIFTMTGQGAATTTAATATAFSALSGLTQKTGMGGAATVYGAVRGAVSCTYTATANVGSVTLAHTTVTTPSYASFIVSALPTASV